MTLLRVLKIVSESFTVPAGSGVSAHAWAQALAPKVFASGLRGQKVQTNSFAYARILVSWYPHNWNCIYRMTKYHS